MLNFPHKVNFPCSRFHKRIFAGAILCGALALSGCALAPSELKKIRPPSLPRPKVAPLAPGESPKITVLAGGTESYWQQARQGAEAAGKKFGARIEWKAPSGDLVKSQKKLVEKSIEKSQGLVLAPVDPTKMMQPVGDAARAGLHVVVFDRDVFTIQNKLTFIHNDDSQKTNTGAPVTPDYYQMGFQSVKAIMDFRATKQMPPREIVLPPLASTLKRAPEMDGKTP